MIVFFVGNTFTNLEEIKKSLISKHPELDIKSLESIKQLPVDISERFIIFVGTREVIQNSLLFEETYKKLMYLIPVGTAPELKEIQKLGIELSEFSSEDASVEEINELVNELISIHTPKEITDDFFDEGKKEMAGNDNVDDSEEIDVEFSMEHKDEPEPSTDDNDQLFDTKVKLEAEAEQDKVEQKGIELPSLDDNDEELNPETATPGPEVTQQQNDNGIELPSLDEDDLELSSENEEPEPEAATEQDEKGIELPSLDLEGDEELELDDGSEQVDPTVINNPPEDEGAIELEDDGGQELTLDDGSGDTPTVEENPDEGGIELESIDDPDENLSLDNSDINLDDADLDNIDLNSDAVEDDGGLDLGLDSAGDLNLSDDDKIETDDDDLPDITEDDDQIDDDALPPVDEDEENSLEEFADTMRINVPKNMEQENVEPAEQVSDNSDSIETLDELDADNQDAFKVDSEFDDESIEDAITNEPSNIEEEDLSIPDVIPNIEDENISDEDVQGEETKTVLQPVEEVHHDAPQPEVIHEAIDYKYDENEMVKLQVLIRGLREERENLMASIEEKSNEVENLKKKNFGIAAELEDAKIEVSILKKRCDEKTKEANEQIAEGEEKKMLYEEKIRKLTADVETLNQQVSLDVTRVRQHEKELESQLELVKMDADSQIKTRDQMIMELKRKIDTLEFNMETVADHERKFKEEKAMLEAKNNKLLSTLKGTMKALEDD